MRAAAPVPRYDGVAQLLHWLIAALAVAVVGLGLFIAEFPRGSAGRELVLLLHRSLGLSVLALMVLRLLWRFGHAPPPLPASLAPIEAFLAKGAHLVLYLLFFAMPISGYLNSAAEGHAVDLFGIVAIPPLVPRDARLAQFAVALHLFGQFLIYVFVAMHTAAALLHFFVRRDGVLDRMLPGRR